MPLSIASTALMSMMTAVAALPVTRSNGTAATATMGSTVGHGDRAYWWDYGLGMCAGRASEGTPSHTAKHLIVDGSYHSELDCEDVCLKRDDYCWGYSFSKATKQCMVYLEEVTGVPYNNPPQWHDAHCVKRYLKEPPPP